MGNKVYIGYPYPVDYETAKSRCQCNGGELAQFSNDLEFERIKKIRSSMDTFAWIGLDSLEGHWEFVDGDHSYCAPHSSVVQDCANIPQWRDGQPPNAAGWCATIWSDDTLIPFGCESAFKFEFPYICEYDATDVKTEAALALGNKAYIGYTDTVDYETAKSRCECNQGELAGFSNDEEFERIKDMRSSMGTKAWIGLDNDKYHPFWGFVDGDNSYCGFTYSDDYSIVGPLCNHIDQWAPDFTPPDYCSPMLWCRFGAVIQEDYGGTLNKIFTYSRYREGQLMFAYICEYDATDVRTENTVFVAVAPWLFNHDTMPWIVLVSVLLSILLIACIGWRIFGRCKCKKASEYSKVKMYSESESDIEEEQTLNK